MNCCTPYFVDGKKRRKKRTLDKGGDGRKIKTRKKKRKHPTQLQKTKLILIYTPKFCTTESTVHLEKNLHSLIYRAFIPYFFRMQLKRAIVPL